MEESIGLVSLIRNEFEIKKVDIRTLSPVALAYIGDGIYELIIRTIIVEQGSRAANQLHKIVTKFVNATMQANLAEAIWDILTEEEQAVYKRGRNAKVNTSAKNALITDYRKATGLEALMGYLYLKEEKERMLFLVKEGLNKLNVDIIR